MRHKRDKYVTPMWCIDGFIGALVKSNVLGEMQFEQIVDIGAGDGRVGKVFAQGFGVPLIAIEPEPDNGFVPSYEGDFQNWARDVDVSSTGKRTLYVSNPPFSQSHEIVKQTLGMLRVCDAACFLLRMNWRASKISNSILKEHPMLAEFPLVPRPSFTGSGTDFNDVAWCVWVGGNKHRWSFPVEK